LTKSEKTPKTCYLVASEIDFDVIAVDVELLIGVIEYGRRTWVTRVTRHVIGHHQYYLTKRRVDKQLIQSKPDVRIPKPVRYPESFHTSVNGQHVRHMPVIEPEPRGVHQNCPVVRMVRLRKTILCVTFFILHTERTFKRAAHLTLVYVGKTRVRQQR